jgi:hypothetical protein
MVIKITAGPIMVATSLLVTLSQLRLVFLQSGIVGINFNSSANQHIGIGQDDHNIHRKVYIESESSFDDEVVRYVLCSFYYEVSEVLNTVLTHDTTYHRRQTLYYY